jgi:hypothetical protein
MPPCRQRAIPKHAGVWAAAITAALLIGPFFAMAEDRLPIPTVSERQQARERVRAIFKGDVDKATTADAKAIVAKKLIDFANDDAAASERFVLLETAEALATKAGDVDLALAAISKRANAFDIDGAQAKSDTLAELAKTASGDSARTVVHELLQTAADCLAADRLDDAKKAAQDAATAAKRTKDKKLGKSVTEVLDVVKFRSKELDRIRPWLDRLAEDKNDLEAVEYVGKYHCFQADRWDLGLPLLARSNDKKLASLARIDSATAKDPSAHLAAGDAWANFADNLKQSNECKAALRRAEWHYQAAFPEVTGLNKARVSQALDVIGRKIGSTSQDWITVFRSADPTIWNTKSKDDFMRFAIPLASLPNNIRFLRLRRQNGREVILAMTKERVAAISFDGRYGWNGAGQQIFGDVMLGIMDSKLRNSNIYSAVAIGYRVDGKADDIFGGYGFGHSQLNGTKQDFCWAANERLPPEPVEISVLARDLNARELPSLIR